ncbi:MAG TPA: pitrilysin family protein [Candidatus Binataceae bacterium]|nr:pitrilysin family protein [Candidatus Binataceae bacterium]
MSCAVVRAIAATVAAALFATLSATASFALEIKRMKLSNGAILLVSEQHQLPMVSLSIAFDAGSRRDPAGKEGLASLTAASLEQGTKDLTAAQFNQKVDFMGSTISIATDRDYAYASMTALKKYEDDTLHLLAQSLENPGLRDSDIVRKRGEQVADIKSSEEEPGYAASVAFVKQMFGNGPYGHPDEGFSQSVAGITPADVGNFYHQYYRTGSAVIAVAGDVDADSVKGKLEKELAGLPGTVTAQAAPAAPSVPQGIHANLINRNVAQANMILGSGGIARSNPDYYKLQVMNYILGGGGFASRLVKVVRSKGGLAYSIESGFSASKFPGSFEVVLQTKNQSAQEALRLIVGQLHDIQNEPVSDAEIGSAKKFLVGSFPLRLDRQSQIVSFMLDIELYNLGLDYADRYPKLIDAVTKDEIQQVAKQYLHPEALDLIAVANQAEAKITPGALIASTATASNWVLRR